jgi:hypothetical protein
MAGQFLFDGVPAAPGDRAQAAGGQHRHDRLGEGLTEEVPPARAAKRSGSADQ